MNPLRPSLEAERLRYRQLQKVVSLLCQQAGFEAVEGSALNALVEILVLCGSRLEDIQDIFVHTHAFAEIASRTRPNLNDVALLLSHSQVSVADLMSTLQSARQLQGLADAAQLHEEPLSIDVSPEEHDFFNHRPEVLVKQLLGNSKQTASPANKDYDAQPAASSTHPVLALGDLPSHLPALPPVHTYKSTPVHTDIAIDGYRLSQLKAEQSRMVEENLKNFMVKVSKSEKQSSSTHALASTASSASVPDSEPTSASIYPIANYQRSKWQRVRPRPMDYPEESPHAKRPSSGTQTTTRSHPATKVV
ncbi:hypothetical protein H4R34_001633 [Dimargaris verticillata]|uniref:Transcription initiation factor TFIID subunit 8 n=1 Tax=Dimargaris verticillata TaxID=2761393 RepID=A0A9W8B9I4_9FUNG|nr:hypothetical protein H4R34_001633 [Dimargaris verticillata]